MVFKELHINSKSPISDFSLMKNWLKEEIEATGEGVYDNWNVIESVFNENNFITLIYQNIPIGFATFYKYEIYVEIGIFAIEPKFRSKGIGKIFFQKLAKHFKSNNFLALKLFCSPPDSEAFWRKMGFIEYPTIRFREHRLMYKPLIKTQKISTNKNHKNKLELWDCEPFQKNDTEPTWSWDFNAVTNYPRLPILQPCNDNWNIRWIKNDVIVKEDKVKCFASKKGDIYTSPFLYIPSIEKIWIKDSYRSRRLPNWLGL